MFSLVGCTSATPVTPSATSQSTQSLEPTGPSEPAPTASVAVAIKGEAVGISCSDIFTPDSLYEMNSNLAEVNQNIPDSNSTGSQIRGISGVSCDYVNLSGGATTEVSVAKVTSESVPVLAANLSSLGAPIPLVLDAISCSVYFSTQAERGVTQALCGQHWVTVESSETTTANDAYPFLVPAILAAAK